MFMAEVAAQKAPDGYETMDVDFVPVSESPMVQASGSTWRYLRRTGRQRLNSTRSACMPLPSRLSSRRNRMSWM